MTADPRFPQAATLALLAGASGDAFVVPGPETLVLFGVAIPVLSGALGAIGIVLGLLAAPERYELLNWRRWSAMVAILLSLELTIVIATGQIPIVALGWGIGLGFSGLTVAETLGEQAKRGVAKIAGAFIDSVAARVGSGKQKDSDNA